jgi:hypothetical protein
MAYCGPRGLAWSEFLSWDQISRDAALLWARMEAETCSCGTRLEEWDRDKGGHPAAYVATVRECPGCAALARRDERLRGQLEKGDVQPGARAVLRLQVPFDPSKGARDANSSDGAAAVRPPGDEAAAGR